jgi:hypothetical protein
MSDRRMTVLAGGSASAPPSYRPELARIGSLGRQQARAGSKSGTLIVVNLSLLHADSEGYRRERVFAGFTLEDLEPERDSNVSSLGGRRRK